MKLAVELPAGTVTEAGTFKAELLSVIVTDTPPLGAVPLRPTVQADEEWAARELGTQVRDVRVTREPVVTLPPLAVMATVLPAGDVPSAFAMPMEAWAVPAEIVTETTAAAPSWIRALFSPVSRHV